MPIGINSYKLVGSYLQSYHIHEKFAEDGDSGCDTDTFMSSYLHSTDGCESQLHWDQSGYKVSTTVWVGPLGWLHQFWYGEVGIRVEKRKSENVHFGRLPYWLWDPGIVPASGLLLPSVGVDLVAAYNGIMLMPHGLYGVLYKVNWDPNIHLSIECRVWDSLDGSGFQTGFTVEHCSMFSVRKVYWFILGLLEHV